MTPCLDRWCPRRTRVWIVDVRDDPVPGSLMPVMIPCLDRWCQWRPRAWIADVRDNPVPGWLMSVMTPCLDRRYPRWPRAWIANVRDNPVPDVRDDPVPAWPQFRHGTFIVEFRLVDLAEFIAECYYTYLVLFMWLNSVTEWPPPPIEAEYMSESKVCVDQWEHVVAWIFYQKSLWNNVLFLWLKTRLETQVIKVITDLSPLYRLAQTVLSVYCLASLKYTYARVTLKC